MHPPEPRALSFWEGRLRRFGHTGWSDAATYAYDQRLRLKAVAQLLDARAEAPCRRALDYGCGVGDFSRLLSRYAQQVLGFDVSEAIVAQAARANPGSNIRYTSHASDVFVDGGLHYDVILSITVLQHITDDAALQALLARMAAHLSLGGEVIVLETLADVEQAAGYIKRRTRVGLVAQFERIGLRLRAAAAFYHPTEHPTPAFKRYRHRWVVRLLGRLAGWGVPGARPWLASIAGACADADTAFLEQAASSTQLMVFGWPAGAAANG